MSSSSNEIKLDFINLEDAHNSLVNKLSDLDNSYFPTPWGKSKWDEVFGKDKSKYLVGIQHQLGEVIGFVLFGIQDPDTAHLYKILVDPKFKRKGLGRGLLLSAMTILREKEFKSVFLEVEQTNFEALEFYRNLGYKVLVAKKDFYGSLRDAWAMECRF